jgi:predicted transcriptional regulator of viral defense system
MAKRKQPTTQEKVLALVRKKGILRPKDLDKYRIARVNLSRLCEKQLLERKVRGLYAIPGTEFGNEDDITEICRRVPRGVIALISALEYHQLTTQIAHAVWIAIDHKARAPKIDYPPIRIVRFSKQALTFGVQIKKHKQTRIRVYSPAKTVADCFRFRNKIGLDVAIEALRDCRKKKAATMDQLWDAAKVCHMTTVMKPYLEAVV